jgi:hypothetical protein
MRAIVALSLSLACGIAGSSFAQSPPQQPADNSHVQNVSTSSAAPTPAQVRAKEEEESAAAALAMSIRAREAEEQRIARYACAAGDASKCQPEKAPTTARTPSP